MDSGRAKLEWKIVGLSAALVLINALVFAVVLFRVMAAYEDNNDGVVNYFVPQDIWVPIFFYLGIQWAVNGVGLTVWRRSRPLGLGLLAGLFLAIVGFFIWVAVVVVPGLES